MRNSSLPRSLARALALSSLAFVPLAQATEVDNFTARDTLTQDAQPVLDAKVNHILERAVRAANRESPDRCNRVMLRQEIVRWTGPDPVSLLELWATISSDVQRTPVTLSESIYAGATLGESPAVRVFGIGRTFRLAGHVVGTDKLGHFFMQGLDYFKRVNVDGADLDHVLRFEHGEDGIWGLKATGVKSYGDMAANFSGFRFWSELYQGEHPYVRCENGRQWVKQREFTWSEYVTDAWDEAINCSEMVASLQARVKDHLAALGLRCPVDPRRCLAITQLDKAEYYVSPVCRNLLGQTQPPKPAAPALPQSPAVPQPLHHIAFR